MLRDDLDAVVSPDSAGSPFASPAALLEAGPDRARALAGSADGVGREVFTQAEAVFGREEVSRAEFASWLHCAAKVLGRDAYADGVAAAEPGMPWRTVWAWWRPVGAHRAEPNLSGDSSAEVFDDARGTGGGPLLKVWSIWTADRWFDLATGTPCPAPAEGAYEPRTGEAEEEGQFLFDADEEAWALRCPGTWEEPVALGGGRFLLTEARGVLVAERNPAVADWPAGGADTASWEEGDGDPWFLDPAPADAPLDAARVDGVFGAGHVQRLAESALPAALLHAPTRELLTRVGMPRHWAAGVTSFALDFGDEGPVRAPEDPEGLLCLGSFELAYGDEGRVLVDGETGGVLVSRNEEEPFALARDTETFVRLLEAVLRYMGACWDPYPCEDGTGAFLDEIAVLEPAALEPGPAQELWEHVFAAITELSVYGY
ncbi:SUKH-4 family immunity protein [Streptomyces sp. NPDC004667]|uniref:SUKH-4 family immunity protein n=1 Tax=Streptomyces sp. NPDC004667 TaxID=3154285 RepID=UPI0033AC5F34